MPDKDTSSKACATDVMCYFSPRKTGVVFKGDQHVTLLRPRRGTLTYPPAALHLMTTPVSWESIGPSYRHETIATNENNEIIGPPFADLKSLATCGGCHGFTVAQYTSRHSNLACLLHINSCCHDTRGMCELGKVGRMTTALRTLRVSRVVSRLVRISVSLVSLWD